MIKGLAHVFDSKLMHCEICVMYVSDLCANAGRSRRAEGAGAAKALVLRVAAVAATAAMTAAATAMAAVMGGRSISGDSAGGVNGGAGVLAQAGERAARAPDMAHPFHGHALGTSWPHPSVMSPTSLFGAGVGRNPAVR